MDKTTVINKMEEVLKSSRKQLAEKDSSTLASIGNNIKMNFEKFKLSWDENPGAKVLIDQYKDKMSSFNDALGNGDIATSGMYISDMQKILDQFKTIRA